MLDKAWNHIERLVAEFRSRPSPQPPFVGPVAALDGEDMLAGRAFEPEGSYFSIRLVEMRLAEGGKYFVEFLPLGICVAEYTYGTQRRRVPLVLSNETVKQMLGDATKDTGRTHFADMPVVRRAPVKHDNLALFVGLFRMPFTDVARSVLQLAADVSEELGGAAFGAGARVAEKLYDRVVDVFSLSSVQPRFAYLDGMALKKSGYLLVSGPMPNEVRVGDLVVESSRLRLRRDLDKTVSVPDGFDYCLLAIEQRDSLFPAVNAPSGEVLRALAGLPFHQRWRDVAALLTERKAAEAEEALMIVRAEVIASPDLTEDDRLVAIGGYDVAYSIFERSLMAKAGGAGPTTRGFRSGTPLVGLKALSSGSQAGRRPGDGERYRGDRNKYAAWPSLRT